MVRTPPGTTADGNPNNVPFETLELCKTGSAGTIVVNESQPAPKGNTTGTFNLASGECRIVADFDATFPANFTITEQGQQPNSIQIFRRTRAAPTAVLVTTLTGTSRATINGATRGDAFLVRFNNPPAACDSKDSKDSSDSKDSKSSKDSKDSADSKDSKDSKDSSDCADSKDSKDSSDSKDSKDGKKP
ncbi:MAG: hypothetical protein WKG32_14160 [Gemmatimonadaceae bacterium]